MRGDWVMEDRALLCEIRSLSNRFQEAPQPFSQQRTQRERAFNEPRGDPPKTLNLLAPWSWTCSSRVVKNKFLLCMSH